ncbi:MAG: GtrA family protein [Bacteroidetes bacterium]|nr:GtrA family protein [Bacteroidota bacterium]
MRIIIQTFFKSRVFRYFVAAGVATVVDISVYYIMLHYVLQMRVFDITDYISVSSPSIALFVSYSCGLVTNFGISKYYVFKESSLQTNKQLFRFVSVGLLVFFLNYSLMSFLIHRLEWYPTVARIFSALSLGVVSYMFHKLFTFMVSKKQLKHRQHRQKKKSA